MTARHLTDPDVQAVMEVLCAYDIAQEIGASSHRPQQLPCDANAGFAYACRILDALEPDCPVDGCPFDEPHHHTEDLDGERIIHPSPPPPAAEETEHRGRGLLMRVCHHPRCHEPVVDVCPGSCFDHALEVAERELARWTRRREWLLPRRPGQQELVSTPVSASRLTERR